MESPEKIVLVAGVTADQTARIKAGELAGLIAAKVGGRGGGRPDFAEAGGKDPSKIDELIAKAPDVISALLQATNL